MPSISDTRSPFLCSPFQSLSILFLDTPFQGTSAFKNSFKEAERAAVFINAVNSVSGNISLFFQSEPGLKTSSSYAFRSTIQLSFQDTTLVERTILFCRL